jgi:hypothetical protein
VGCFQDTYSYYGHLQDDTSVEEDELLLEAVGESAILADHISPIFRSAFPSSAIASERSSPSRVRFAAPNNGALLTAPGRSEQHLLDKRERLMPNGLQGREPLRRQNGTLFRRHRHELQQKFCIRAFHEEVLSAGLLPTDVFAGGERQGLARGAFDTARSRKCSRGLLRLQTGAMD